MQEGNLAAVAEYNEQIEESKVHAAQFKRTLEMAAKRFTALANATSNSATPTMTRPRPTSSTRQPDSITISLQRQSD